MKNMKSFALAITFIAILMLSACSSDIPRNDISASPQNGISDTPENDASASPSALPPKDTNASLPEASGQIYLYGERHRVEVILDKELELWHEYYHEEGMRHLFVELPYYAAEFMNMGNTAIANEFYQTIKNEYPETVLHGTDVGHEYDTIGKQFLEYLEANGLEDSEQYSLTLEAIEQGKSFYEDEDFVYREDKMVENFIREFDKLGGESIVGIYGSAHVPLDGMASTSNDHPGMANQLREHYGDVVHSEDLRWVMKKDVEPLRTDSIIINGKEYEASYFGEENISSFGPDYIKRRLWRLENAYGDFADKPKTGGVLPYSHYPILIETGQVFVVDYTKEDGSVERRYYRSDGNWMGMPSTEEFRP